MLHFLNVLLSNPWPKYFGEGGIEKSNCLQVLHSVYGLQKLFESGEFAQL